MARTTHEAPQTPNLPAKTPVAKKYDPEPNRERVRTLAKAFPANVEHHIATQLGIAVRTLRNHHRQDLDEGRAELLASIGAQMVARALDANHPAAKGDFASQMFVLTRMGGWSQKVHVEAHHSGSVGSIDLSRLNSDQLRDYGRLAAIAEGLDPSIIDAEFSEVGDGDA